MADIHLHRPVLGIDNVSPDFAVPIGAVRDAADVTIDRDGGVDRRDGRELAAAGVFHSLWTSSSGQSFCVKDGALRPVTLSGPTPEFGAPLLADPGVIAYAELNDQVVLSSRGRLWRILDDGSLETLALDRPAAPGLAAWSAGGLYAGRYAVAVSLLRGAAEGPLSPAGFVEVGEGQGILVQLPGAEETPYDAVRVYRTGPNGDVLMRAQDVPYLVPNAVLGVQDLGRPADSQHMEPMGGGQIIAYWRGRLLAAAGATLRSSQPLRYGVTDPRTDWVEFPRRIDLMLPVEGGVFVGTADGVVFLGGKSPGEWERVQKSAHRPIRGSGLLVRANLLGGDEPGDRLVAVWLSASGFVVGRPDGALVEVQAKRIRLPDSATAAGVAAAVVHDRQIIASIN